MSVIENALAKMRRAGGKPGGPESAAPAPHSTLPAAAESPYARKRFAIDRRRLHAAGYLPDETEEQRFVDYYHRIKRPLIQTAFADNGADERRLVMVSSALAGEGKTFTTLNLALSMARERDMSVLVVDADLPRTQISSVLGLDQEPGLLDALHDAALDVESLVLASDVPGLEVLPAGGGAGSRTGGVVELIASARMREVTTRLCQANARRLMLFDSPPLLLSSEARSLAQIPGQIVLVARVGYTPRHSLLEALRQVEKTKLQGIVLNDAYRAGELGYYGYGYNASDAVRGAPTDSA